MLALTVLGGRDRGKWLPMIRGLHWFLDRRTSFGREVRESHYTRLSAAIAAATTPLDGTSCFVHVERLKWDVYVGPGGSPMLWAVMKLRPHDDSMVRRYRKVKKLSKLGTGFPPTCVVRLPEVEADIMAEPLVRDLRW